ncbi:hypothetical protein Csa_018089 [Cucumis sativus]|nr:hypothetical protein Csa_018089 [Cucumis sativus]
MKRWRLWGCFKRSFLFPTKLFFLRLNSHLLHKPKGNGNALLSLYKDIESCGEYRDIQVMWDMIQSHNVHENTSRSLRRLSFSSTWRSFCFQPT